MLKKIIGCLLCLTLLIPTFIVTGCAGDPVTKSDDSYVKITVVGGSGSGYYKKGTTAKITADEAPEGKEFAYWLEGDVADDDRASAEREFAVVVNEATTFTAFYEDEVPSIGDLEYVTLTVNGAAGSGVYVKGSTVRLYVDQGGYFDKWLINGEETAKTSEYEFVINEDTVATPLYYKENVLLNKNILAASSSHKTFKKENLIDGNMDTFWATNAKAEFARDHYITIDLLGTYEIKAFFISERGDLEPDNPEHPYYYRIEAFEVEYSMDGDNWTIAAEYDEAITENREIVLDEVITAKYLRLQYHDYDNENTHLREFQAFGNPVSA